WVCGWGRRRAGRTSRASPGWASRRSTSVRVTPTWPTTTRSAARSSRSSRRRTRCSDGSRSVSTVTPHGKSDRWYHKGVVLMRARQVPKSTTDQRLLEHRGEADWLHTDPWRVLRIQAEFVEGFGALAELGPAVSIFGSARTGVDSPWYAKGVELG